jgi:hypothetical protein
MAAAAETARGAWGETGAAGFAPGDVSFVGRTGLGEVSGGSAETADD